MITISRVKQAADTFIKVLRYGKADIQTALPVFPFGVISKPLKEQLAAQANTGSKNNPIVLGYIVADASEVQPGETLLYSTNFKVFLKEDGTAEIGGNTDNMVRFSDLETAYNQLKDDHDALVTAFNQHVHPTAAPGAPSPPTPVPNVIPATLSTGDISDAKIEEIKTLANE
jgi:hypothetical protein